MPRAVGFDLACRHQAGNGGRVKPWMGEAHNTPPYYRKSLVRWPVAEWTSRDRHGAVRQGFKSYSVIRLMDSKTVPAIQE